MLKEKWLKIRSFSIAQGKNILKEMTQEIKSWKLKEMTAKKALNITIFLVALGMGIYFQWTIIEIVIFLIFIGIILRPVSSRILAMPALFFLILTPLMLILKQDILAEKMAIYAYYFLVMAVIMGIREVRNESKVIK